MVNCNLGSPQKSILNFKISLSDKKAYASNNCFVWILSPLKTKTDIIIIESVIYDIFIACCCTENKQCAWNSDVYACRQDMYHSCPSPLGNLREQ